MNNLERKALANVIKRRDAAREPGAQTVQFPAPVVRNEVHVPEQPALDMMPIAKAIEDGMNAMAEMLSSRIDRLIAALEGIAAKVIIPEINVPAPHVVVQKQGRRRRRLVYDKNGEPIGFDEEDAE